MLLCHILHRSLRVRHRYLNGLGLESQNLAAEVKIRAERGELLRDEPLKEGRPKKRSHNGTVSLKQLGLTKNDSSRWQAIARIPEDEFEKPTAPPQNPVNPL